MPELSPELANRLFPYMGGIVKERKGVPLVINGHRRAVARAQDQFLPLGARTVSPAPAVRVAGWLCSVHRERLTAGRGPEVHRDSTGASPQGVL